MSDIFYQADKSFEELMKEKKNFVFVGEAGSGKSELVLNFAVKLAEQSGQTVDLYDLDQTKPLYRSRDMADKLAARGVKIHYQEQYLDAPTVVGGIAVSLQGEGYTLLDIGGGQQAAKFAGAYSHILRNDDSLPVYVVNPYRPWTKNLESVDSTMTHILNSIRLEHLYLLANPNVGYLTTAEDCLDGIDRLNYLFDGICEINSVCARREIADEVQARTDKKIIPIDLYLTYEWIK